MQRFLSVAALVLVLVAPALPAPALPGDTDEGELMVVWIRSDGTSGRSPLREFPAEAGADNLQTCGGVAPVVAKCVLEDTTTLPYGGFWQIGFIEPSAGVLPGGVYVGSTVVELVGTKSLDLRTWSLLDEPTTYTFGCNWYYGQVFAYFMVGDINCGRFPYEITRYPAGDLTATFTAGAFDGRFPPYGFPTRSDVPLGAGNWAGILRAE